MATERDIMQRAAGRRIQRAASASERKRAPSVSERAGSREHALIVSPMVSRRLPTRLRSGLVALRLATIVVITVMALLTLFVFAVDKIFFWFFALIRVIDAPAGM